MNTVHISQNEQEIINILGADYPETARVMNAEAICEEAAFGRDGCPAEDELPPQEIYDGYEAALSFMAKQGWVEELEVFEIKAWCLTPLGRSLVQD